MVSSGNVEILYLGPDGSGHQVVRLRREDGSTMLQADYFAGQPFFAWRDKNTLILFSDDAAGSGGMARPWLPVPMTCMFRAKSYNAMNAGGEVYGGGYADIDNAQISGEAIMYQGNASIVHKRLSVRGVWGRSVGAVHVPKYRVRCNGTEVGNWTAAAGATGATQGPFDISSFVGLDEVVVTLTVQLTTGGAGATAVQLDSMYMRQT
jgi:hypothetical protein